MVFAIILINGQKAQSVILNLPLLFSENNNKYESENLIVLRVIVSIKDILR